MRIPKPGHATLALLSAGLLLTVQAPAAAKPEPAPSLRQLVEADWVQQERRWGREPDSAEALEAALVRTTKLLAHGRNRLDAPTLQDAEAALAETRTAVAAAKADEADARASCYRRVRWLCRDLTLRLTAVPDRPLLFMQRNRYVCQMLHEYMGYFYDYGNVPAGGALVVLERPGLSLNTRPLLPGQLTNGNFTTLALSPDARTVYFAFAERSPRKPDFYSPERRSFHLYRVAPMARISANSRTVWRTTLIPARCRTAASPSCPRAAAALRDATTPGSRAPLIPSTGWTPTVPTSAPCRSMRPASGIPPS